MSSEQTDIPTSRPRLSTAGKEGFTLVELVLATAISAFVVGILAVCFSFALRVWEITVNPPPDQTSQLADLLERQLAEFLPTPIKFPDGPHPLFIGQQNSIAFITAHSVKAISQGVPVIARYTHDPGSGVLQYSELLLNPNRPDSIQDFVSGRSSNKKETSIRSYGVDFPEFVLSYAGREAKQFSQSWESTIEFPVEVLLRWRGKDSVVHARICMLNSPFPIEIPRLLGNSPAGGVIFSQ